MSRNTDSKEQEKAAGLRPLIPLLHTVVLGTRTCKGICMLYKYLPIRLLLFPRNETVSQGLARTICGWAGVLEASTTHFTNNVRGSHARLRSTGLQAVRHRRRIQDGWTDVWPFVLSW